MKDDYKFYTIRVHKERDYDIIHFLDSRIGRVENGVKHSPKTILKKLINGVLPAGDMPIEDATSEFESALSRLYGAIERPETMSITGGKAAKKKQASGGVDLDYISKLKRALNGDN